MASEVEVADRSCAARMSLDSIAGQGGHDTCSLVATVG